MSLPLNQRGFSHDNTQIWTLFFMPQHHLSCYDCLPSRLEYLFSPGHLQRPEEVHSNQVWWKNSCFGKVPHGLGVSPSNTMFLACSVLSALRVMQCGIPLGINVLPSTVSLSRSMLATGIYCRIWQKAWVLLVSLYQGHTPVHQSGWAWSEGMSISLSCSR